MRVYVFDDAMLLRIMYVTNITYIICGQIKVRSERDLEVVCSPSNL